MSPHYLYLDSKIVGTAKQIAQFFAAGIFAKEQTTVLIKRYKHKSAKQIARVFLLHGITYRFVLAKDIDALQNGIVWYPFNAQSNCRVVANRHLLHIFMTHGESNKAASIKPILRIYDCVATAGQAGIDRLLHHKIFSPYDVENGRVITAGDTFIGNTGLSQQGEACIFYAPTWEGGVEQENYSSLKHWQSVAQRITQIAQQYKIHTVLIRPHPNTGHRVADYQQYLGMLCNTLLQQGFNVQVYQANLALSRWQRWLWQRQGIKLTNKLSLFQARFAFCDVSAMETQLLNEHIAYELFYRTDKIAAIVNFNCYHEVVKVDNQSSWLALNNVEQYRDYLIDPKFSTIPLNQRIDFLISEMNEN